MQTQARKKRPTWKCSACGVESEVGRWKDAESLVDNAGSMHICPICGSKNLR